MLQGQPLHPLKHALQLFTEASKQGWGAHLNDHTARGTWSLPESKLHINYLELKAVLGLRKFQDLSENNIVLIATDNTIVVAYISKEGCISKQVTLKARHIPSRLNVVADKLSRLSQMIQTEWSLFSEVFQAISNRWHQLR